MASDLVAHVTAWLTSIAPRNVTILAEPGLISVRNETGSMIATEVVGILNQPDETPRQGVLWAIDAVLSTVQDFISEEIREPWPVTALGFASPRVDISSDGMVTAGYAVGTTWILQMPLFCMPR